jgi:hypothetical protein
MLMRIAALLLIWLLLPGSVPPVCQWTHGSEVGKVDTPISEDSGLAVSRKFPNRLYHANDSGDSGRFFLTDFAGRSLRIVGINNFDPEDVEDLAIGPCGAGDCIFIGDIGDNSAKRGTIELVIVQERENFPLRVTPNYRVRLRYPDGPHDAESLAVHPDGTVFILTKGGLPQLYRLKKEVWMRSGGQVESLERVAAIDFEKLGGVAAAIDGRFPTAMDISPDGKRVLVLTYRNVFELFFDLAQRLPPFENWKPGLDYRRINVEVLPQQESIAFTPDGRSFFYDTEKPLMGPARIMRSDCR